MPAPRRLLGFVVIALVILILAAAVGLGALYYVVSSKLPDIQSLRHVELQEPLYVYSADGKLIGMFGETRRYPVTIAQVPKQVQLAFVAAEDAHFYTHHGIDMTGVSRAVWQIVSRKPGRVAGGSTITQQVARQFFLDSEYSYTRKLKEMMLAMRIEHAFSKDEILEIYLNKSFFGNRAYGIAAAAEYYYGKSLDQLTVAETATLVSCVKFPSSGNPISNPQRNHQRSVYVFQRMLEDGYIGKADYDAATAEPMHAAPHERPIEVDAPYAAEMVRQEMIDRFGGDVLTRGYRVTTTLDSTMQNAAGTAVRNGLELYDHRHGWHGVEKHFDLPADADDASLADKVNATTTVQADMLPAIVLRTDTDGGAVVVGGDAREMTLPGKTIDWLQKKPADLIKRGDLIRIKAGAKPGEFTLDQAPEAQSALVSLDAYSGAIKAIIGGYSFAANKFNRVTQARRQPGSSFKPFVYSAAFEKGFNPASIVLDAPVIFRDRRGHVWEPQNDKGGFSGPMRLREALVQSKNLVSVRLLDSIGVDFARKFITQFGFSEEELPPNLSMALGTASLTPLSMARGYATFANGGSRIDTWLVDNVQDRDGKVIYKAMPALACRGCGQEASAGGATSQAAPASNVVDGFDFGPDPAAAPAPQAATKPDAADAGNPAPPAEPATPQAGTIAPRAIDERTVYQLVSMMRDVVLRGTGTPARVLNREDVGGKTGSTNDYRDAWFSGFGSNIVTSVWVGRDDFRSLGRGEYGGRAALPIWIDYMRVALKDQPVARNVPPQGMTQITLNGATEWVKNEDAERAKTQDLYDNQSKTQDEEAFDIF